MDFDIENEWQLFLDTNEIKEEEVHFGVESCSSETPPEPNPLYISTKSLINYISTTLDINTLFWMIPISEYATPNEGIIKKQMKFTTFNQEDLDVIQQKLSIETCRVEEQVSYNINNPTGRIKFKDVRKISVGISKRDIMSSKSKKIGAFYNCLALIVRIRLPDEIKFREMHVKLFNTGKLEIPGIQSSVHGEYILNTILDILNKCIRPLVPITVQVDQSEIVLINSNFNCNFYINRDALFEKLQKKYSIKCIYDPCSYPGIQCKYTISPGVEVSYMIFRTGSVLIVGKCTEEDIYNIYEYVKNILHTEYSFIHQPLNPRDATGVQIKPKKIRTKTIHFYDI